jgi:NitT/TauT family transport system substrate-binding protein
LSNVKGWLGVKTPRLLVFLVGLCCALTACGGPAQSASGDALRPLTLTFSTKEASYSFALLGAVAKGAGFFEDEGLDVTIETTQGGAAAVQSLVAGQSDVVTTVPSDIMAARQTGGADVVCFQALITGFNLFPAAPVDSDVRTYQDLAGKRIAVTSLSSSTPPLIRAMTRKEGADPQSITFVPVPPGAPALHALRSGEVDVLGYWDTQYAAMAGLGLELRPVHAKEGIDDPSFALGFAATSEWLRTHPDDAAAFGRATARAYLFTKANPAAAAAITKELYPQLQSSSGDERKDIESGVREIQARLALSEPVDDKIGYVTTSQVEKAIQLQVDSGAITPGLAPRDIWTDEFIDEINTIDRQDAENRAKNYQG